MRRYEACTSLATNTPLENLDGIGLHVAFVAEGNAGVGLARGGVFILLQEHRIDADYVVLVVEIKKRPLEPRARARSPTCGPYVSVDHNPPLDPTLITQKSDRGQIS